MVDVSAQVAGGAIPIASLPVGAMGGATGVAFALAKHQACAVTGSWASGLEMGLAVIR